MSWSHRRYLPWLALSIAVSTPFLWHAASSSAPALQDHRNERAALEKTRSSHRADPPDMASASTSPLSPHDFAQRMYTDAQTDSTCEMVHRLAASADSSDVDPPNAARRQLMQACAKRADTSIEDIVSRMQVAADAGDHDAMLYVVQRRLDADSADVDALAAQLTPDELPLLREWYADDVRALTDLALTGDAAAAGQMADLHSAGKLVPPDPVKAAGWQLYGNSLGQTGAHPDDVLIRDPALEDMDQSTGMAAIAFARSLFAQTHARGNARPMASP